MTLDEVLAERLRATREYLDLLEEVERKLTGMPVPNSVSENAANVAASADVRLLKWPLADAIPVLLESFDEPATAKELASAFKRIGREFGGDVPVRAVRAALKKAMAVNPDVYTIGWAKYHLRSKSTRKTKQIEKAFAKTNGTGGRSTKEHGQRTADGIAKRRGEGRSSWGPTKKVTPELLDGPKKCSEMARR